MLLCLALTFFASSATAHDRHAVPVQLSLSPNAYELLLDFDVPSLMLSQTLNHSDPAETAGQLLDLSAAARKRAFSQAERFFRINFRIEIDGKRQTPQIELPDYDGGPLGELGDAGSDFRVRIGGAIPEEARTFRVAPGRAMGALKLEAFNPAGSLLRRETLRGGMIGPPITIPGEEAFEAGTALSPPDAEGVGEYMTLGLHRWIPAGGEHMLFVVAMLLLTPGLRPLAGQLGVFMLAWGLALGLAAQGYLNVPDRIVTPAVTASAAVLAVDNVLSDRLRAWRPSVVFGLGTFHGLAFAGPFVAGAIGVPAGGHVSALLAYGAGLAAGTLLLAGVGWGMLGWAHRTNSAAQRMGRPVSAILAGIALIWTLERIVGG